ncbi:hypothetical protein C8R43DRAFT_1045227 [Mycena crocata]|nr:hypothetical protein C8R43DRAFT_1045227 [Mycena crocata]
MLRPRLPSACSAYTQTRRRSSSRSRPTDPPFTNRSPNQLRHVPFRRCACPHRPPAANTTPRSLPCHTGTPCALLPLPLVLYPLPSPLLSLSLSCPPLERHAVFLSLRLVSVNRLLGFKSTTCAGSVFAERRSASRAWVKSNARAASARPRRSPSTSHVHVHVHVQMHMHSAPTRIHRPPFLIDSPELHLLDATRRVQCAAIIPARCESSLSVWVLPPRLRLRRFAPLAASECVGSGRIHSARESRIGTQMCIYPLVAPRRMNAMPSSPVFSACFAVSPHLKSFV